MRLRLTAPIGFLCAAGAILAATACAPPAGPATAGGNRPGKRPAPVLLHVVGFVDPVNPQLGEPPVELRGARNETVHFAVQLARPVKEAGGRLNGLRLQPLQSSGGSSIGPENCSAAQLLPMPVQASRTSFVRNAGTRPGEQRLLRALMTLPMARGEVRFSSMRNPDAPTDPASRLVDSSTAPSVWFEIRIPPTVAAGEYVGACELVEGGRTVYSAPVRLVVEDFVLPDERHLQLAGQLDWDRLVDLYPSAFQGIPPGRLARADNRHAPAVKILDDLVRLAQAHRLQLTVPRLQPLVKWPSGQPPQVDWQDFDSIVGGWLSGSAFADTVPLGTWPIPWIDQLERYDEASQAQYLAAATAHFVQMDWITRSAIVLPRLRSGRIGLPESVEISEQAARMLAIHPQLRVAVPLEEELVQLATPEGPGRIPPASLSRVIHAAAGVIYMSPLQRLPEGAATRWMRADQPALVPGLSAGATERDVRLWAWLAFLRDAQHVRFGSVLPSQSHAGQPVEADEQVWFYPGEWFGLDQPLPTVQLKWLRKAQQDYEYLWLARQRGQGALSIQLAKLLVRPVEIQPVQRPDPAYVLLSGTSDSRVWEEVLKLLARTIHLAQPGQDPDPSATRQLSYDITAWTQTQDRPLMIARSTGWSLGIRDTEGRAWAGLRLGVDLYNLGERHPDRNRLQWSAAPSSWRIRNEATDVPRLGACQVAHFPLEAQLDLEQLGVSSRSPLRFTFVDGFSGRSYSLDVLIPAAWCERRTGRAPLLDGSLGEWLAEDALHEGRLVQMLSRPTVQSQQIQPAAAPSALYSTWTENNFYLAFKVEGIIEGAPNVNTSFASYDSRRAWGEDICEVLAQGVFDDNSLGPVLHIACKPRGQVEAARRLDPKSAANPWLAFSGADIRYAASTDRNIWRGEMSVPWESLAPPGRPELRPRLLRFNFSQHTASTGESASWAGPVDFGRDEQFTGLLELRESR